MLSNKIIGSPIHLLIRYSDYLSPGKGTINEHGKILKKYGYVWFGKYGRTIGSNKIDRFLNQIHEKEKSYVFLVRSVKNDKKIVIGQFTYISKNIKKNELSKVPEYYRNESSKVGFWLKIEDFWEVERGLLRRLMVASSGFSAFESINKSMAAMFFVKTPEDFNLQKIGAKKLKF